MRSLLQALLLLLHARGGSSATLHEAQANEDVLVTRAYFGGRVTARFKAASDVPALVRDAAMRGGRLHHQQHHLLPWHVNDTAVAAEGSANATVTAAARAAAWVAAEARTVDSLIDAHFVRGLLAPSGLTLLRERANAQRRHRHGTGADTNAGTDASANEAAGAGAGARTDAHAHAQRQRCALGIAPSASAGADGDSGDRSWGAGDACAVCGGNACLDGDLALFTELRQVALAAWRKLRRSGGGGNGGGGNGGSGGDDIGGGGKQQQQRVTLFHDQSELFALSHALHELVRASPYPASFSPAAAAPEAVVTAAAEDVARVPPWVLHRLRIAHGETIRWLEFNGHTRLAHRVRHRATYGVGIWSHFQETPDVFNRDLHQLRPQNREPFPFASPLLPPDTLQSLEPLKSQQPLEPLEPLELLVPYPHYNNTNVPPLPVPPASLPTGGGWRHAGALLRAINRDGPSLMREFRDRNNNDLRRGPYLVEHEQGLQRYSASAPDAAWFRTTFWKGSGAPCVLPAFTRACTLLHNVERRWRDAGARMYIVEAKWLTVFPGTWIRPHTADSNQNLKVHWCGQNPGGRAQMRAGNRTVVWETGGSTHFLQDAFVHEVRSPLLRGAGAGSSAEPRVVLDVKMIHPDISGGGHGGDGDGDVGGHDRRGVPALGFATNLPMSLDGQRKGQRRRQLLANQLLEKLVSLDGDQGRQAQYAAMKMLQHSHSHSHSHPHPNSHTKPGIEAVGDAGWRVTMCDDLDLDHDDFEIWPAAELMRFEHLSRPLRKRRCLRRLLLALQRHGWRWYGRRRRMRAFVRWLDSVDEDEPPPFIYKGPSPAHEFISLDDAAAAMAATVGGTSSAVLSMLQFEQRMRYALQRTSLACGQLRSGSGGDRGGRGHGGVGGGCHIGWACVANASVLRWPGDGEGSAGAENALSPAPRGWNAAVATGGGDGDNGDDGDGGDDSSGTAAVCLPCGLLDGAQRAAAGAQCNAHLSEALEPCITAVGVVAAAAQPAYTRAVSGACALLCPGSTIASTHNSSYSGMRSSLVPVAVRLAASQRAELERLAFAEDEHRMGAQAHGDGVRRAQRRWYWVLSRALGVVAQLSRPRCRGCAVCAEVVAAASAAGAVGAAARHSLKSDWPVPPGMGMTVAAGDEEDCDAHVDMWTAWSAGMAVDERAGASTVEERERKEDNDGNREDERHDEL